MPVIREERRYSIGRVGVARTYTGGNVQNNAATTGAAIAQGADEIAGLLYREGARLAEKAGVEMGSAAERQSILTINPETGAPEAYESPGNFGTIASEAYQRVVMSRFQADMEEEIKNRGRLYAEQYRGNIEGYTQAMGEYIAAMSNNATGQFKTYIEDVGTGYINATRTSMAIEQIRAERAAAAAAAKRQYSDYLEQREAMIARYGPEALSDGSAGEFISAQAGNLVADGETSGVLSTMDVSQMSADELHATARGFLRYEVNGVTDPELLKEAEAALKMNRPDLLPAGFENTKAVLAGFGGDLSELAEIGKFGNSFLTAATDRANVIQAREVEAAQLAADRFTFDIQNGPLSKAAGFAKSFLSDKTVYSPATVMELAVNSWGALTEQARSLIGTNDDASKNIVEQRDAIFEGHVDALAMQAVDGLTPDEAASIQLAIETRDPMDAAPSARAAVRALLRLDADVPEAKLLDRVNQYVDGYQEDAGPHVERMREAEALRVAENTLNPMIYDMGMMRGVDVDKQFGAIVQAARSIPDLDDANDYVVEAAAKAGTTFMHEFFDRLPSAQQITDAKAYIDGSENTGELTPSQVALLNKVRLYVDQGGNKSGFNTDFGRRADAAAATRAEQRRRAEQRDRITRWQAGGGDANSEDERLGVESWLNESLQLGDATVAEILMAPDSANDQRAYKILDVLSQTGVLPDSLHDVFTRLGNGTMAGQPALSALSHWENLRDRTTTDGASLISPAISNSMSADQIAFNDMLAEYTRSFGPEAIDTMITVINNYENDPNYTKKVDDFYGRPVEEFVATLDNADQLAPDQYQAMVSAAKMMAAASSQTRMKRNEIKDRLQNQIAKTYPDGRGVVINESGGSRTPYSLERTVYHPEVFEEVALEMIGELGINVPTRPVFGRESTFSQNDSNVALQPVGQSSGVTQYRAMILTPLGYEPVYRSIKGKLDGQEVEFRIPLMISTNDSVYTRRVMELGPKARDLVIQGETRMEQISQQPMP